MPTKPRHLKTPTQLWVTDGLETVRRTRELPSSKAAVALVAQVVGVSEDTVRGWRSRGNPTQDAVPTLENLFGVAYPPGSPAIVSSADLVAALERQAEVITELVEAIAASRVEQQAQAEALATLAGQVVAAIEVLSGRRA